MKFRMSESIDPNFKKLLGQIGYPASGLHFIDAEMRMCRIKCTNPWNGNLNHRWCSIARQQILSFLTEKRVCDMLIELGPMSQVMIEAVCQTGL